jgi:hypothetical protein
MNRSLTVGGRVVESKGEVKWIEKVERKKNGENKLE